MNSVMAGVECGIPRSPDGRCGLEDNFQRVSGVAGTNSEYPSTPGGGGCDGDAYSQ